MNIGEVALATCTCNIEVVEVATPPLGGCNNNYDEKNPGEDPDEPHPRLDPSRPKWLPGSLGVQPVQAATSG